MTVDAGPSRDQSLRGLVDAIAETRRLVARTRSLLVAISGIDGCGKGHVTREVARALEVRGHRVANINIDAWLNLPRVRYSETDPGEHFYRHALRFDALFSDLVRPLRDRRSISIEARVVEETDTEYRRRRYEYNDTDVILLEGIFLLKRDLRHEYDRTVWIDCSLETALARAVARAQEGLPPAETTAAYERIYFPAQAIHAERDHPREAADLIFCNDAAVTLHADARILSGD